MTLPVGAAIVDSNGVIIASNENVAEEIEKKVMLTLADEPLPMDGKVDNWEHELKKMNSDKFTELNSVLEN
jgi:hypothetical protein